MIYSENDYYDPDAGQAALLAGQKRVINLYRVSTAGQLVDNDIPMQHQAVHEYEELRPEWKLVGEFYEKGVSGFKISEKDRDRIIELRKFAVEKKFDVLCVFMHDRIGRREDETPFLVQWFIEMGIEIWSVKEGQIRIESHVDKLMNFLRFWTASGESIKTGIRINERRGQLAEQGLYSGGWIPYGYMLIQKGRVNKKKYAIQDLAIDDDRAKCVQLIYRLYVDKGFGYQAIADHLTSLEIKTAYGNDFTSPSIRTILMNPSYTGVVRYNSHWSEPIDDLQIIDPETFMRAQTIRIERSQIYEEERTVPRTTTGKTLLSGNGFCGVCGARLNASSSSKGVTKDGSSIKRSIYRCYNKSRHKSLCDGQATFRSHIVDEVVDDAVKKLLQKFKTFSQAQFIDSQMKTQLSQEQIHLKQINKTIVKYEKNLDVLQAEIANALRGDSSFTTDHLSVAIKNDEQLLNLAKQKRISIEQSISNINATAERYMRSHQDLLNWSEIYTLCDREVRKMIISNLISRVEVSRGSQSGEYNINIEFKCSYEQYLYGDNLPEPQTA